MNRYIFLSEPGNRSSDLFFYIQKALAEKGLDKKIGLVRTQNVGFYSSMPVMRVIPDDIVYKDLTHENINRIIEEHFIHKKPVTQLLHKVASPYVRLENRNEYYKQFRIVLRNMGCIDPENIRDYIKRDGYRGLEKILKNKMTPDDVIDELKISGLRGRGGAGFPTWKKWKLTQEVPGDEKYVICNADEGDPGAYMDRSTLEGDPHSILEGMTIAGFAVGSRQGYIYIRAEYPLAIKRLEIAISQARELGLLGPNILGTDFSFDIELRWGAGAFVCGEETALIASIEGNRGMPRPRPPYPSVKGLWDKPSVINNVETYANVPVILDKGGSWFAKIGTETSKGTKVFALTGKTKNSGLIEVPMGMTLREIIFDIGGGIKDNKKIKAVQTGGPSGGVIPESYLDTPVSYESLQKLGSIMGSGGMIVMDEDDCMVDVSKYYLQFAVDESCGKCSPCRIGGKQLYDLLEKISKGSAVDQDLDRIKRIGQAMLKASLCGLGQNTPNPVLSTLKYFPEEYDEHIRMKKCRTGKCKDLVTYLIDPDKCIGCSLCALRCPVKAITGEKKKPYFIHQDMCIKCGECYNVCKFSAVKRD
ncbi:MAG: NADH-quinone oxidoreductase subunit NuoF [bacterium]|nr:NADH-quinone oxidoreductase subunit NuoF [bacterium]